MEDMARLALIEQNVRDNEEFNKMLHELLQHIYQILENPHDYENRSIKSDILTRMLQYEAFTDYLKYVGFQSVEKGFTYPKEQTLSNLRMAQAAIERKIYFCCGSINHSQLRVTSSHNLQQIKKVKLVPANILKTKNPLLLKIEALFNNMIKYENEELQQLAREHIPIVTLQLMALDRVREHQKKIKSGEITGHDLSFDIALLMELLGWFKYKFFSWVDKPDCELCGGSTVFDRSVSMTTETETCTLELYKCRKCVNGKSKFARYNDARTLLRTRRGRCGEWANCFALLCRALGYDTRYVYDTTDHVWCEIYDYDSNTWLHVDPCEAKLNAPLIYSHGWRKQLAYVIAVSKDDLQDVTWRYTTDHKQVLKRRNLCDERELIQGLMTLREHRQRQVSEARRRYLTKRGLEELVQLMVERKPTDYESHGRISGAKEWRSERGEIGADRKGHVFEFSKPGSYAVRYYTAPDKYRIARNGTEQHPVDTWSAGVYDSKNIFRKLEKDWQKVYLAREDGDTVGSISWKLMATNENEFNSLSIRLSSALYENGNIDWKIKFDNNDPLLTKLGEITTNFSQRFTEVTLTAELSGGVGEVGWQHAQLFRQSVESKSSTLEILAVVEKRN